MLEFISKGHPKRTFCSACVKTRRSRRHAYHPAEPALADAAFANSVPASAQAPRNPASSPLPDGLLERYGQQEASVHIRAQWHISQADVSEEGGEADSSGSSDTSSTPQVTRWQPASRTVVGAQCSALACQPCNDRRPLMTILCKAIQTASWSAHVVLCL